MPRDPIDGETVATEAAALKIAKVLGCEGAHKTDKGWVPCESREGLMTLIRDGKAGYEKYRKRKKRKSLREKAMARRTVVSLPHDEEVSPTPARRKKRRRRRVMYEPLGERGIRGIETLPGGGLASQKGTQIIRMGFPESAEDARKKKKRKYREGDRGLPAPGRAQRKKIRTRY